LAIFLEYVYPILSNKKLIKILAIIIIIQNSLFLIIASLQPAHGPIKFYKHLYYKNELIDHIYSLNVVRDQLHFYQKNDIIITHIESPSEVSSIVKHALKGKTLWFLADKLTDRSIFQNIRECKLDYSAYPDFVFKFNFFNWMKRSKIWTLYRCENNGL